MFLGFSDCRIKKHMFSLNILKHITMQSWSKHSKLSPYVLCDRSMDGAPAAAQAAAKPFPSLILLYEPLLDLVESFSFYDEHKNIKLIQYNNHKLNKLK